MSAELMKSQIVRHLPIVCPSVRVTIIFEINAWIFLSNFSCGFPWAMRLGIFGILKKNFF